MKSLREPELKVARAANAILWLWKQLVDQSQGDMWFKYEARRAFQDSIICMQACGLIEDYDVLKVEVKIKGIWTNARQVMDRWENEA